MDQNSEFRKFHLEHWPETNSLFNGVCLEDSLIKWSLLIKILDYNVSDKMHAIVRITRIVQPW